MAIRFDHPAPAGIIGAYAYGLARRQKYNQDQALNRMHENVRYQRQWGQTLALHRSDQNFRRDMFQQELFMDERNRQLEEQRSWNDRAMAVGLAAPFPDLLPGGRQQQQLVGPAPQQLHAPQQQAVNRGRPIGRQGNFNVFPGGFVDDGFVHGQDAVDVEPPRAVAPIQDRIEVRRQQEANRRALRVGRDLPFPDAGLWADRHGQQVGGGQDGAIVEENPLMAIAQREREMAEAKAREPWDLLEARNQFTLQLRKEDQKHDMAELEERALQKIEQGVASGDMEFPTEADKTRWQKIQASVGEILFSDKLNEEQKEEAWNQYQIDRRKALSLARPAFRQEAMQEDRQEEARALAKQEEQETLQKRNWALEDAERKRQQDLVKDAADLRLQLQQEKDKETGKRVYNDAQVETIVRKWQKDVGFDFSQPNGSGVGAAGGGGGVAGAMAGVAAGVAGAAPTTEELAAETDAYLKSGGGLPRIAPDATQRKFRYDPVTGQLIPLE